MKDSLLLLLTGIAAAAMAMLFANVAGEYAPLIVIGGAFVMLLLDNRALRKQLREHGIEPRRGKQQAPKQAGGQH